MSKRITKCKKCNAPIEPERIDTAAGSYKCTCGYFMIHERFRVLPNIENQTPQTSIQPKTKNGDIIINLRSSGEDSGDEISSKSRKKKVPVWIQILYYILGGIVSFITIMTVINGLIVKPQDQDPEPTIQVEIKERKADAHGETTAEPASSNGITEREPPSPMVTPTSAPIKDKGSLTGTNNDGSVWEYSGEYIITDNEKIPHGIGNMKYSDVEFDGEWINGLFVEGMFINMDGDTYNGEFIYIDDIYYFHGNGKMVWKNGDWYNGEWFNGLIYGNGTYYHASKNLYETGVWVNGIYSSK